MLRDEGLRRVHDRELTLLAMRDTINYQDELDLSEMDESEDESGQRPAEHGHAQQIPVHVYVCACKRSEHLIQVYTAALLVRLCESHLGLKIPLCQPFASFSSSVLKLGAKISWELSIFWFTSYYLLMQCMVSAPGLNDHVIRYGHMVYNFLAEARVGSSSQLHELRRPFYLICVCRCRSLFIPMQMW